MKRWRVTTYATATIRERWLVSAESSVDAVKTVLDDGGAGMVLEVDEEVIGDEADRTLATDGVEEVGAFIDALLEVHRSGRCRGGAIPSSGGTLTHSEECQALVRKNAPLTPDEKLSLTHDGLCDATCFGKHHPRVPWDPESRK